MNILKKTIGAAAIALASFGSVASNINVGGVVWNPDWVAGGFSAETDFVLKFNFTQWFSTINVAQGDASGLGTSASNATGINNVLTSLDGSSNSTGFFLSGTGEANRINNISTDFCPSCELTLAFGGLDLLGNGTYDTTNSWINLYVDNFSSGINYIDPPTTVSGVMAAMDGNPTPWLEANFSSFFVKTGTVDDGSVSASLQITGGLAGPNFLGSPNGGIAVETGSAFFNTGTNDKFSSLGNGSVQSDTIPEPTTLAIFGLGLLGLAGASRRKQS